MMFDDICSGDLCWLDLASYFLWRNDLITDPNTFNGTKDEYYYRFTEQHVLPHDPVLAMIIAKLDLRTAKRLSGNKNCPALACVVLQDGSVGWLSTDALSEV